MATVRCSCGFEADDVSGPTHRYMLSAPGCWAAYGRLLAREYEDPARWRTHRYSVDAYAVQHPGIESRQARNSVGIHLSRLCLLQERGWELERANAAMLAITAKKFDYPWLTPPTSMGRTFDGVLEAPDATQHMEAVLRWAGSAWEAWSVHHPTVRDWLRRID